MYRVAVLGLSVKGNRVAKAHELVSEDQLAEKPKDLIAKGSIVKATDEEIKKWKASRSGSEKETGSKKDDLDLTKAPSDMKTAELEAKAKELKIDISKAKNNKQRAKLVQAELDALAERKDISKEAVDLGIVVTDDKSNEQIKEEIAAKREAIEKEKGK